MSENENIIPEDAGVDANPHHPTEPTIKGGGPLQMQQSLFQLFDDSVGELSEPAHDEIKDQYFTRKVTPSPSKIELFLLLEPLTKVLVHQTWLDSGPEHFLCNDDCQLCLIGDKAIPFLIGRVYLMDEDMGATLMLSLRDTSKTKSVDAIRGLQKIAVELGPDEIWRTPFELSLETTRTGIRHLVIEPDKMADGKIFVHRPQDPDYVAAHALREKLTDEPLLRPFSLDRDECLLPRQAKRIRRKLGLQ
jgi:hypothetical protein